LMNLLDKNGKQKRRKARTPSPLQIDSSG